MPKKITTIEGLAQMTQQEFAAVRGEMKTLRTDMGALRTDMETGFRAIADSLDLIRQDFAEMKRTLSLLAQTVGAEIGELRRRVERIERRLGLTK